MNPVVVAMSNMVGRIELLSWLKSIVPRIPGGEVRKRGCCYGNSVSPTGTTGGIVLQPATVLRGVRCDSIWHPREYVK